MNVNMYIWIYTHIHHVRDGPPQNSSLCLLCLIDPHLSPMLWIWGGRTEVSVLCFQESTVIYYKLFAETCFEEKQMKQVFSVEAE